MTAPFGRPLVGNDWAALADDAAPPRTVSVVVTHFDQQAQLDRTLGALRRQTHPSELLEIVVADDGSPSAPRVPAGVALVRQEDRGFRAAAARNLGARHSSGDIVCFLDADTVPERDYVAQMARLPSLAPDVVAVGRRRHALLEGAGDEPIEIAGPALEIAEPAWLRDAYRRSGDLLEADDRSYRFVISAVLACSRWLLDEVGGFDESFDTYGGEDWEWAHRAWLEGAALAHVPGAVAWHDGPDWAGRDEADRLHRKNAETLRLLQLIAVPGAAPRALLGPQADALITLRTAPSVASALVCIDSVLEALPGARVIAPAHVRAALAHDPRVIDAWPGRTRVAIDLPSPLHVDPAAAERLREALAAVGSGDLGTIDFGSRMRVSATRARARERRWGQPTGWRTEERSAEGLRPLGDAPDLEAYLGGWWQPPSA